jgi:hypothetical protein
MPFGTARGKGIDEVAQDEWIEELQVDTGKDQGCQQGNFTPLRDKIGQEQRCVCCE